MKIYLAGPDVFLPDARHLGSQKQALCKKFGFHGLFPLDNEVDLAADENASRSIFSGNVDMMDASDVVIANLTPFRSVSADPGTVFEVGYFFAKKKVVYGYSNHPLKFHQRILGVDSKIDSGERVFGDDGFVVETFDLSDNLMIEEAIARSGGRFWKPLSGAPRDLRDLEMFETCLKFISEQTNAN